MSDRRIAAENKRLLALFAGVDENKVDFVRAHIAQLAWYNIQIRDLQKAIDETGTKEQYQNGRDQSGNHANPDLKTLIELQKLTNAIVKVLLPMVPEKGGFDELAAFRIDNTVMTPAEREQSHREICELLKQSREKGLSLDLDNV